MRSRRLNDADFTLDWVNQWRRGHGLAALDALPVGRQRDCCDCPAARALQADGLFPEAAVSGGRWTERWLFGQHYELPVEVCRFIRDFDAGKYPELIA